MARSRNKTSQILQEINGLEPQGLGQTDLDDDNNNAIVQTQKCRKENQ